LLFVYHCLLSIRYQAWEFFAGRYGAARVFEAVTQPCDACTQLADEASAAARARSDEKAPPIHPHQPSLSGADVVAAAI
jgi:hypothetical protein